MLSDPGVRVHSARALSLLAEHGAQVDFQTQPARIPADLARRAVESMPRSFHLYDAWGRPAVHYGGCDVHFDPGSAAIEILDHGAEHARAAHRRFRALCQTGRWAGRARCHLYRARLQDVPQEIADLYRLYLALRFSRKPVVICPSPPLQGWSMCRRCRRIANPPY